MNTAHDQHSGELPGNHGSYWLETAPRPWYPRLEHALHVDAVVIGAGITGITTALFLKKAGLRVAVLEGGQILQGVTGSTTAKITSLHTLVYRHLLSSFGEEKARQYAEANQSAIGLIETLVGEYSIDCGFERQPFCTFANTESVRGSVEKEVEAAQKLGLPASFVDDVPIPVKTWGAVRFDGQAQFHPVRYLSALAREIPGDGSYIFENSRAVDIVEGDICQVSTKTDSVNAPFVVIATHYPIHDRQGFYFARLHQERHYAVAARINKPFPGGMYIEASDPEYAYRVDHTEKGDVVIVSGGHHKTGQGKDTREYYRELLDHVREVYPGSEVLSRWSAQAVYSVDHVPYIGRLHAGDARIFTATGFGAWGMTTGTAAAAILSDMITGKDNPWAPVFDPGRFKPGTSAKEFLTQNLNVGKEFIMGHLGINREKLEDVAPGQGKIVSEGGKKVGVYRDEAGMLHAVHPVCTHMGCTVAWNSAEKSWDCPCHGSRFTFTGDVIHSPATTELQKAELDAESGETDHGGASHKGGE